MAGITKSLLDWQTKFKDMQLEFQGKKEQQQNEFQRKMIQLQGGAMADFADQAEQQQMQQQQAGQSSAGKPAAPQRLPQLKPITQPMATAPTEGDPGKTMDRITKIDNFTAANQAAKDKADAAKAENAQAQAAMESAQEVPAQAQAVADDTQFIQESAQRAQLIDQMRAEEAGEPPPVAPPNPEQAPATPQEAASFAAHHPPADQPNPLMRAYDAAMKGGERLQGVITESEEYRGMLMDRTKQALQFYDTHKAPESPDYGQVNVLKDGLEFMLTGRTMSDRMRRNHTNAMQSWTMDANAANAPLSVVAQAANSFNQMAGTELQAAGVLSNNFQNVASLYTSKTDRITSMERLITPAVEAGQLTTAEGLSVINASVNGGSSMGQTLMNAEFGMTDNPNTPNGLTPEAIGILGRLNEDQATIRAQATRKREQEFDDSQRDRNLEAHYGAAQIEAKEANKQAASWARIAEGGFNVGASGVEADTPFFNFGGGTNDPGAARMKKAGKAQIKVGARVLNEQSVYNGNYTFAHTVNVDSEENPHDSGYRFAEISKQVVDDAMDQVYVAAETLRRTGQPVSAEAISGMIDPKHIQTLNHIAGAPGTDVNLFDLAAGLSNVQDYLGSVNAGLVEGISNDMRNRLATNPQIQQLWQEAQQPKVAAPQVETAADVVARGGTPSEVADAEMEEIGRIVAELENYTVEDEEPPAIRTSADFAGLSDPARARLFQSIEPTEEEIQAEMRPSVSGKRQLSDEQRRRAAYARAKKKAQTAVKGNRGKGAGALQRWRKLLRENAPVQETAALALPGSRQDTVRGQLGNVPQPREKSTGRQISDSRFRQEFRRRRTEGKP